MAFAHSSSDDGPPVDDAFWLRFVHIFPHDHQDALMDRFRQLCPWIQKVFDGYTVDTQLMSEAAWQFLHHHHIPYDNVTVPRDQD